MKYKIYIETVAVATDSVHIATTVVEYERKDEADDAYEHLCMLSTRDHVTTVSRKISKLY